MGYVFSVCLIVISCLVGWMLGNLTIAKECNLMGSFYISNTVYECRVKEKV